MTDEEVRRLTNKLYWIDSLVGGCVAELDDILMNKFLSDAEIPVELKIHIEQYRDSLQFAYEAFPDNDELLQLLTKS